LDFVSIALDLKDPGSSNLFELLLQAIPGASASQVTDCEEAETIMGTLTSDPADPSLRTDDENVLYAFIGLAKMGAVVSSNLDTNKNGVYDDGTDPCSIPDTDAAEIATGLVNAANSLSAISSGIGKDLADNVETVCDALNSIDPSFNICLVTDAASVTSAERQVVRGMVKETDDKLGLKIGSGDSVTNACGT
jgi:hypothetical protein